MRHTSRSLLLFLLLLVFHAQCETKCQNFLVQQCIDIPFEFYPISTIKCIQLIPKQFYNLKEYSVQNYVVKRTTSCYDIVPYTSSSTPLFSNACNELCREEYCRLFDKQPNTTVINIFYSQSFIYEETKSVTSALFSYDYFLFDTCPAGGGSGVLLIVVYALAGFIGFMTIAVILQCIISRRCKGRGWDWRYLRDRILCRHPADCRRPPDPEPEPAPYFITDGSQVSMNNNQSSSTDPHGTSSPLFPTSTSNPKPRAKGQKYPTVSSSGNETNPVDSDPPSERTISTRGFSGSGIYHSDNQDVSNISSVEEAVDHHHPPSLLLRLSKLSSRASSVLSATPSGFEYRSLPAKPSRKYPIIRL